MKPCPFCGGEAEVVSHDAQPGFNPSVQARCKLCYSGGPEISWGYLGMDLHKAVNLARQRWDQRHGDQQ